jgi:hypothetical protein
MHIPKHALFQHHTSTYKPHYIQIWLEYQKLVIWPRMTDTKETASSKQGQSSMGDACWLARRQSSITLRKTTKILYKGAIHARNGNDNAPLQPPDHPPLNLWHHKALQRLGDYSKNDPNGYIQETVFTGMADYPESMTCIRQE